MDRELKIVLSEMRRLMNYNRSSNNLLNEQGSADINIDRLAKQKEMGMEPKSDPKMSIFYKQNFKKYKGYFDNDMMLGEFFDVVLFSETDNALTSMDIPSNEIFKDVYGYYTKGKSISFGGETRIYLPKDEFFKGLVGIVKSFTAYKTKRDQNNKRDGRKYTLVYQLVEPEKAISIFTEDADGVKETSTDPSRGWQITNFAGNESGYFAEDTSQEPEGGWRSKSDVPKNNMLPQYFNEYSLQNYGEEYARSEFDIWYDSGWGIATVIAAQILTAILTAGIGNAISAAVGATGLASTAIVVGAELSVEFTIGLIEANYLFGRGYKTGAYMVLIFSLFPVFNRLGIIERLSGRITEAEVARLLKEISKDAKTGKFTSPGDVKSWLKSLDDETRRAVEELLQKGSKALEKAETKAITQDINKSLNKILNEIKTKGLTKEVQGIIRVTTKEWPKLYGPTLKLIGIDLGVVVASLPLFSKLVEDDEELKRDPQGFFDGVKETMMKMQNAKLEKEIATLTKLGTELQTKALTNKTDTNSTIELLNFMKDVNGFGRISYEQMRTNTMKELYLLVVQQMKNQYVLAGIEEKQKVVDLFKDLVNDIIGSFIADCANEPKTPFKTKDEVCKFLDWVYNNKKNNQGVATIEVKIGDEIAEDEIIPCSKKISTPKADFLSDRFLLNSCETKLSYKLYGKEYLQSNKNQELIKWVNYKTEY